MASAIGSAATALTSVDKSLVENLQGTVRAQTHVVQFDPEAFWVARQAAAAADDGGAAPMDTSVAETSVDRTSYNEVIENLSAFRAQRSMLEELVEDRGHILQFSTKYHAECAGNGVEYAFGRCKWWFITHNRHSTEALYSLSKQAFDKDVVTLALMRKYARKCRDYHRVYRFGTTGLVPKELLIKTVKTHRAALDTHFSFISSADPDE